MSVPPTPPFPLETVQKGFLSPMFDVQVTREGKRGRRVYRYSVHPQFVFGHAKGRIEGIMREAAAKWFERLGWTRCMITDPGFCHMKGRVDLTWREIIHMDYDHVNGNNDDHRAGNLEPACSSCNSHKQRKPAIAPSTPERERTSVGQVPQASSLESAKHDPQRAAWDAIIEDGSLWAALDKAGTLTFNAGDGRGKWYLAKDAREIAVKLTVDPVYGKYSSETFGRYLDEDRFDTLEMVKDRGRWLVRTIDRPPVISNIPASKLKAKP